MTVIVLNMQMPRLAKEKKTSLIYCILAFSFSNKKHSKTYWKHLAVRNCPLSLEPWYYLVLNICLSSSEVKYLTRAFTVHCCAQTHFPFLSNFHHVFKEANQHLLHQTPLYPLHPSLLHAPCLPSVSAGTVWLCTCPFDCYLVWGFNRLLPPPQFLP